MEQVFHREIIVCGDDPLAKTIAEELRGAGARIIKINNAADLLGAGVHRARAVVCAGPNDAVNLEIALLARQFSPDVRVVARLANSVLREAVADVNGPGAILNVADLAAPSVVEAVLSRNAHQFETAGIEFVVWGAEAPYNGTLREIYNDLAPVAVVHGKNSPNPGEVVPCPGRDQKVYAGDFTSMIGVKDELESRGIVVPSTTATRSRQSRARRVIDATRAMRDEVNPMLFPALTFAALLTLGATSVVHYFYENPRMSWLDALYFASETITTVGFGESPFGQQSTFLRLFVIGLMFAGVIVTAIVVAFLADLLLSQRFLQTAGLRRARHMRDHIVIVGLGSVGIRVVTDLAAAGYDVLVIEHDETNRYLPTLAELDVPVIFGNATMRQTLESARVDPGHAEHRDRDRAAGNVGIRHQGPDCAARSRSRAEHRGESAVRFRECAVDRGPGSPLVHRRGNGPACAGHVLGRATLLHGRRNAGGGEQRAGWNVDGGNVHPHARHRDHSTGRADQIAPAP
jgi:voltage-gated potassium channel Kch